jgi:cytoskeletal protein CcmA (bactofilin family)
VNANVVATGEARFARGSCFFGNVKSYRDTIVEEDARVHGSIVCGGAVHLGRGCFVAGPLMVEGDVVMDPGSSVGAPHALTTLSSQKMKIAAGCRLHGTVWPRANGIVES